MDFELIKMFLFQVYLAARDGLLGQLRRQMEILDKRVGPEERIKIVNTKFEEGEQSCSLLIAAARNGHEEVENIFILIIFILILILLIIESLPVVHFSSLSSTSPPRL